MFDDYCDLWHPCADCQRLEHAVPRVGPWTEEEVVHFGPGAWGLLAAYHPVFENGTPDTTIVHFARLRT